MANYFEGRGASSGSSYLENLYETLMCVCVLNM